MFLLTGHRGFLGRCTASELSGRGYKFKTLEREKTYADWVAKVDKLFLKNEFKAVLAVGAISANQYPDLDIFDWNTYAARYLAAHCAHKGVHLVFVSSQVAVNPHTLYGHSKKLAESLITAIPALDVCILRPFNIWGPGEDVKPPDSQSLAYRLAAHNLEVLWDTERDYIHVADVAKALLYVANHRICGTYDMGTGVTVSSSKLASLVEYDGYENHIRPSNIQRYACADPDKMIKGWMPTLEIKALLPKLEQSLIQGVSPEELA
jgi:nucleoside-diphosphate-sugar epimerase